MIRQTRLAAVWLMSAVALPLATTSDQAEARWPADQPSRQPVVETTKLRLEVINFLGAELAAHIAAIRSLDPPPDKVLEAGATGEYTWGTFMRSVAAYSQLSGQRNLAGRDLARFVADIGLLERRLRGTRFSQLYAAQSLRYFGLDLETNPLWQSLSENERVEWRALLDPLTFYDPKTRNVIKLPENYLGVAARIGAIGQQLGLTGDRPMISDLIDRAAHQFTGGALYADDAPPTGRFDRYSNEYARFIWDAAETAGRQDILRALRPTLTAQMKLWWDLVSPDGYGYAWGRSLGVVSYMDTLEIVGFLGQHAEFRPAPLAELASAYYQAWRWLRSDYRNQAHLLSIFAFGRGNYRYISADREWQQTAGFFGKLADAHMKLMPALEREGITSFPASSSLRDVARFEFFARGSRKAGVWLVRQGPLRFTLPVTTGTQPGISDYLPSPHGLPGFAAPVEQAFPALTPYLEISDGKTIVAADGADEIDPAPDGRSVKMVWRRWALVGAKPAELIDPHLTSEVTWRIDGTTLTREERLTASEPVTLRRWRCAIPTTGSHVRRLTNDGINWIQFESPDGGLSLQSPTADWPLAESLVAGGDGPLGRGTRCAVPLHLLYESRDVTLEPGRSRSWRIVLRADTGSQSGLLQSSER